MDTMRENAIGSKVDMHGLRLRQRLHWPCSFSKRLKHVRVPRVRIESSKEEVCGD
jgi:hypothetical protein